MSPVVAAPPAIVPVTDPPVFSRNVSLPVPPVRLATALNANPPAVPEFGPVMVKVCPVSTPVIVVFAPFPTAVPILLKPIIVVMPVAVVVCWLIATTPVWPE